jgi:hypothetical protein
MTHDMSGAILSHVSNFAVGLVIREEGRGSKVLGSGVLVSIEGRRGILTCGHVAEAYERLPEIGLIRFVAGGQQRRMLKLGDIGVPEESRLLLVNWAFQQAGLKLAK